MAMASLAETRDNETGNHIRRTQNYVRALATRLSAQPKFAAELTPSTIELLYKSAPLHDIGKVGIPDAILLKPGKLTAEEFDAIKKHPAIGAQILGNIKQLQDILPGVLYHHETWSGRGGWYWKTWDVFTGQLADGVNTIEPPAEENEGQ